MLISCIIFVSMQGQQLLFNGLIGNSSPVRKSAPQTEATARRDEKLAYRYYYHIEIQRTRYDDVLLELEKEFDISSSIVVKCLKVRYDLLKQLLETKPPIGKLQKLFPYYVWRLKPQ